MHQSATLPKRSEVPVEDTWDLSSLFRSDAEWENAFAEWEQSITGYTKFRGELGNGAQILADCLTFDAEVERTGERIGNYAFLKESEDASNSTYQGMKSRYMGVASKAAELASFIRPEIMALPETTIQQYLADPRLADYRLLLDRLLRHKPHTLGHAEERLLALQIEMAQTAQQVFHQLTNTDMNFGDLEIEPGRRVPLGHASFSTFLHSTDREVRKKAFHQYYQEFEDHAHTLAASLAGSVQRDVYYARARNYADSLSAGLFDDNVPKSVYTSLIEAVESFLPTVHEYYRIRQQALGLEQIHQYDTYVPILPDFEVRREWNQAVELVLESLAPLGDQYVTALSHGLRGRWCDRYENKGKRSGAFSAGGFDGDPYILMNYQPEVLDHVFTLAHEAGHSMHTYFSARNQPFIYYNYTIFVAEVASTFNEQLLSHHLMKHAKSDKERAYYITREIDDMRGTIVRQTMFASFEKTIHEMCERNEPLTLDAFRTAYQSLLERFFGPDFTLDEQLSLECLRIPHFYRAFYVYKYATGMSAAIALADRVLQGGKEDLNRYLKFLQSGCSKYPLELLRDAGVDMESPEPVKAAMKRFQHLVSELKTLVL